MSKLTVYHGSSVIIEKPQFGVGNPNNDYGLGFYCTETLDLAKEWACSAETDGYANKYVLDMSGLSVLSLTGGEYHILNWLAVLLENRKFRLGGDVALQAQAYIFDHFSVDYKSNDVIKGYRADDSYFFFRFRISEQHHFPLPVGASHGAGQTGRAGRCRISEGF